MNKIEHLLVVLGEECAEVAQRASKAIRFGLYEVQPGQAEDNKRRIERELADLMATAELLGLQVRDEDKDAKREKLREFMDYAVERGTLQEFHECPGCRMPVLSISHPKEELCVGCSGRR